MNLDIKFQENTSEINAELQENESLIVDLVEKSSGGGTFTEGYEAGYSEGEAAGQKAEGAKWWDLITRGGTMANMRNAFGYTTLTAETFKPPYTIKPTGANCHELFYFAKANEPINLIAIGEELGYPVLDFSDCTNIQYSFSNCLAFSRLGTIDVSKTGVNYVFYRCSAEHIEKLIVSENTGAFTATFNYAENLKHCIFEGVITKNINLSYSPLSVESMKSAILCLKNYAGTDSELLFTISFTAECWAALEADSTAPNGGTWKDYVQYTLCWNI